MNSVTSFANILFAGHCNAFCPDCIGLQLKPSLNTENLQLRPLRNQDQFIALLKERGVTQISLTGTITDPLLYRFQRELIDCLRSTIDGVQLSVHTNGRLIKKIPEVFNLYDRAAISIPSFKEAIYKVIMGTRGVPDLEQIYHVSTIPIKISTLVNDYNCHDIPSFVEECYNKGVRRLVLRRLFGEQRSLTELIDLTQIDFVYQKDFMNNPVYNYHGMEVTLWEFEHTENIVYNLFADGTISNEYILERV